MLKLGDRNYTLISEGAKTFGTWNPSEILCVFEEQLYVDEAEEIIDFLQWMHDNDKTLGHGNYEEVFAEFKKSIGFSDDDQDMLLKQRRIEIIAEQAEKGQYDLNRKYAFKSQNDIEFLLQYIKEIS